MARSRQGQTSKAKRWVGTWVGGRIARGQDGRDIYWIWRMRDKRLYRLRLTGVWDLSAATEEYELWRANPDAYVARRERDDEAARREIEAQAEAQAEAASAARAAAHASVILTDSLLDDFLGALEHGYGTREPTSEEHLRHTRRCLQDWQAWLNGRDLRSLSLSDLRKQLGVWGTEADRRAHAAAVARARRDGLTPPKPAKRRSGDPTGAKHRIAAIKTLAAWLRWSGRLQGHEDPTASLQCVQTRRPSREALDARVYTVDELERTYRHIANPQVRAIYYAKIHTGMHESELQRIATGDCTIREVSGQGEIAAVVEVEHKGRHEHRQSIDKRTLKALQYLQGIPTHPIRHTMIRNRRKAMELARAERMDELGGAPLPDGERPIPEIMLGNLRHTRTTIAEQVGRVVYPAAQQGVPLHMIARSHGHATGTAAKFYSGVPIPPMIAIPVDLHHPVDRW